MWEAIGKGMEELGFPDRRNAGDCERKFKNLKRSYISTVDHNNTSGNDRKTCAYFDEMSTLFQQDARIQPGTLCSSRAGTKIPPESKSDKAVTCSESENEDIPRKRKIKPQEKERMQELREMHTEKVNGMGRFLEVFKKSFKKDGS